MRSDHQRLLRAVGFRDVTELDVTSAFAATAAASALPFRAGSFDAVIHTDVLC